MITSYLHSHQVMGGYRFLMENYVKGDRICMFGFSRGAYTARCLAGMLNKVSYFIIGVRSGVDPAKLVRLGSYLNPMKSTFHSHTQSTVILRAETKNELAGSKKPSP